MDLSPSVLGRAAVSYIEERRRAPVLRIGRDEFDRAVLAGVACFNFAAAANLSRLVNQELRVKDTRDVFDNVTPQRFAIPRLGPISIAVLGAAFEAKGIGGPRPLESWVRKHHDNQTITFGALKHRAPPPEAVDKDKPKRKRSRSGPYRRRD